MKFNGARHDLMSFVITLNRIETRYDGINPSLNTLNAERKPPYLRDSNEIRIERC
jgi:hypothetical protein